MWNIANDMKNQIPFHMTMTMLQLNWKIWYLIYDIWYMIHDKWYIVIMVLLQTMYDNDIGKRVKLISLLVPKYRWTDEKTILKSECTCTETSTAFVCGSTVTSI